MTEINEKQLKATQKRQGCSYILIFVSSIVWILGTTIIAQLMQWIMEQSIFEASFLFPDLRWAISFAYSALISLPFFMLGFLISDPLLKKIFRFWAMVGILGFLLTPAKLIQITDAIKVSAFQIIGIWILYFVYDFWRFRGTAPLNRRESKAHVQWPIVISLAGLITIPWVMYGALGSWLDSLMNLIVGVSAAFLFLKIYNDQLISDNPSDGEGNTASPLFNGFIFFAGLLILSTVLGQTSQQWMLAILIPFSSWVVIFIFDQKSKTQFLQATFFLGMLISLPLIWFDPDEMALIISTGAGEAISWVNRSIFVTITILLILTVLVGVLKRKKLSVGTAAMKLFAVTVWLVVVGVYFLVGTPGFFGEEIFVILKNQADVSDAVSIPSYDQRKIFVYQSLVHTAIESQKDLVETLDKFGFNYTRFYLVNAIEIKAGPLLRAYLSQRSEIDRILDSPHLRPLPEQLEENFGDEPAPAGDLWNLEMIGVYQTWETFDVKGEGIIIGQSDSGVDGDHPGLRDQYLGIDPAYPNSWYDPWNDTESPTDIGGHGTHTLGIILGKKSGIAPESKWIGCVNLARNLGNPAYYLDCMQFTFAPFPKGGDPLKNGDPTKGAHILNNSWGCPEVEGCDSEVFLNAVTALRSAGIFVVASAGNSGYYGCESVSDPLAIYSEVVTVGAIDKEGELADFSSLGPVSVDDSGRIKPDLVAPGVDILSTMPGSTYQSLSGTSMAGPHVAGVVALMWSANPNLIGNIDLTEKILFDTSTPFEGLYPLCIGQNKIPNNASGFGVVNAFNVVEAAMKNK